MPELKFLPNDAGEGEGLSDAGIETYRADPFPAVARETSQNSRDAHVAGQPVIIEFERLRIAATTIPGYETFKRVARWCLESAVRNKRKKETAFFEQALRVLSQPEIPVLRISDFNTKGLRGPCTEGSPFHSLVKSSGVSNKEDDTSGGSFGIGKSAVYSASDLQTAFYSTAYPDGSGGTTFLCQGKTKFTSFTDDGGRAFRSVGYWGDPAGYLPITDMSAAPAWMAREVTGTTVCSVGVRESDDWQREILASLLMNFFSAVHKNEMEFRVDGQGLHSRNLRLRFDDPANIAAAKEKQEDYAFAKCMYECLTNDDEATEHALRIEGVGTFRLRLIVKDGLPKRVGILRNGMYICDNLGHFGDKFSRFPMFRDFVAMVEPADDSASAWLRRMENPRHDELSPERLLTPAERRAAKKAGQALAAQIRDKIREAAKPETKDETDLDELSEFFALDTKGPTDEKGKRDIESFKVQKNPQKARTRSTKPPASHHGDGIEGGAPINGDSGGRNGGGAGAGKGSATGGRGSRSPRRPFVLRDPRTLLADPTDLRLRTILFTPAESGEALLAFESSGLSEPQILPTVPSEYRVRCIAGERTNIQVEFATPYAGPIEVLSWIDGDGDREA